MEPAAHRFTLACRLVALIWLLIVPTAALLPFERSLVKVDVPQFYLAGRMVWLHHGDALYPIPHADSVHHPGLPEDADPRPAYAAESLRLHIPARSPRFIGPPPFAVLLAPWSALPPQTARLLWSTMLALAQWGIALVAASLARELLGRRPVVEGLLILLIAVTPRSYVPIALGNISSLVGLTVGLSVWGAVRERSRLAGSALAVGVLLKYAPAVLAPALLAARRWRFVRDALVTSLALALLSILMLGVEPWRVWLTEIAPRLGRAYVNPNNQSLWSVVAQMQSMETVTPRLRTSMLSSALVVLAAFCWLLVRRKPEELQRPALFLAACAGLVSWLLIWSPISWNGYQVYLMPFWGWVIWETTRGRIGAFVGAVVALSNLPFLSVWLRLFRQMPPIVVASPGLWCAAAMLGLAMIRLWRGEPSGEALR